MDQPEKPPLRQENIVKVIDCDVHPYVKDGIRSVFPYMPEAWQQRFTRKRAVVNAEALSLKYLHPNGTVKREDALLHCEDPKVLGA